MLTASQDSRQHEQFFTSPFVSDLLVNQITLSVANDVLELGSGSGSLLSAVRRRWSGARLTSVDIDGRLKVTAPPLRPHRHIVSDVLSPKFPRLFQSELNAFDAAVCNPPYRNTAWRSIFGELLREAGLKHAIPNQGDIPADVIFLAHNLRFLKVGGQLAIIVPDGTITGAKSRALRESLLSSHQIHSVIELPERSFLGTEAKTFILTLEKATGTQRHIPLYQSSIYGHLSKPIAISPDAASRRMDYHYYAWQRTAPSRYGRSLGSLKCVQVLRGQISATEARRKGLQFLHSTDMANRTASGNIHIPAIKTRSACADAQYWARPGDIVVTRVGRQLGDKVARVVSGSAPISDCLYVIRGPKCITECIWNELTSPHGREWFKAHARGVCAKVLNKADLLAFPLPYDIEPWPN